MDFQAVVNSFSSMACIVSVEKKVGEKQRKYRIVTGNKAYIDTIEHPVPMMKMLTDKFTPNAEYTNYLTRDLNFETYCYQAAVEKKCLHSYAHPDRMDIWFNMTFLPLDADDENLAYCIYLMECEVQISSKRMSGFSEEVATSVLDICIRLRGTNNFKSTMGDIIANIRELCDAEHCCILLMDEINRSCSVLGEAFSKGTKLLPMQKYLDDKFYDIAESWESTIAGSNCLIVKDEQDMLIVKERNPVWYESLTQAMVNNIVLFPLKSRNQLLGYMWAINYDGSRSTKIKETLEVTTFILGSELGNYMLVERLRLLGSKDLLTGVMNRNEMNIYVESLSRGEKQEKSSVAVLFADLNGLKEVNDSSGHSAGDSLLKNAATVLKMFFSESEIFRAGGDEFAIIALDLTEDELNSRSKKIREASEEFENLSFSLGGCVEKECRNIRMALRIADENMYKDKKAFYENKTDKTIYGRHSRIKFEDTVKKTAEYIEIKDSDLDYLTGLMEMNCFFKVAEHTRRSMHESGREFALVFFNISGLTYYNKRFGFAEGDSLLKDFAVILKSHFEADRCSRFGQDQFAVFAEKEGLEEKLELIFKDMKKANKGNSLFVRAGIYPDSMGLVEISLACDRAKQACEKIRDENRSYYTFFDNKMLEQELNKQYVINNLDRAIEENWITAFYQPIVRATTRRVCDEEALVRWIDPERGMLSPADFIPILEETRLIYKVDLRMVDIVIEKIKKMQQAGMYVVPQSVNLSRTDFEMCNVIEEICNRVDSAGIARELITIEITESVIGSNFDYMKEQIERFQKLGFSVWMDDFGSGYSSLNLLQELHFDLIKFDMRFMKQFDSKPESRIILTELMRLAVNLSSETVCEGVETAEQVEFLTEIGCTKIQGYYFSKPISYTQILERYERGIQIGFENPAEIEYNSSVSSINLYNLTSFAVGEVKGSNQYFNSQPMLVSEYDGKTLIVIRCNQSYKSFAESYAAAPKVREVVETEHLENNVLNAIINAFSRCENEGQTLFLDEKMSTGDVIHVLIKKVSVNPLTKVTAFACAILGITPKNENILSYSTIARALSSDFIDLYYVDLETEDFAEYLPNKNNNELSVERKGQNFFEVAHSDANKLLYSEDRESFITNFTKENIKKGLQQNGSFEFIYRYLLNDNPVYVSLKAVGIGSDNNQIVIGVSNIDASVRQRKMIERLSQETVTYNRISALVGDFLVIYTVNPENFSYIEYSSKSFYSELGTTTRGNDFFADARSEFEGLIHSDDIDYMLNEFTKEKFLETFKKGETVILHYRLKSGASYRRVCLRACLVEEEDGPQLIVGVFEVK